MASSILRVGLRANWRSGQPVTAVPACLLSINCIYGTPFLTTTAQAKAAGHSSFWLWGAESARPGSRYGQIPFAAYVHDLASELDAQLTRDPEYRPDLVGGHNEWNVDWHSTGGIGADYDRIRQLDRALHAVCQKHGVPFCLSSTLAHDWNGGNPGWEDFQKLYPPGEPLPGQFIDLHIYANDAQSVRSIHAIFQRHEHRLPLFIGEVGLTPLDFRIRPVLEGALSLADSDPHAIAACWFCAQDGSDNPADSSYGRGLWTASGSPRPALAEFRALATERANDRYQITGGAPVPDKPVKLFLIPSRQVYNRYPDPGDGDYADTEADAMEWFANAKVRPLAEQHTDWDVHVLVGGIEPDNTPAGLAPLRATMANVAAYAWAHPAQKVIALSLHTDAPWPGHANHFAMRFVAGESEYLQVALRRYFTAGLYVFADYLSLNSTGQGYIALPESVPNLVPVILEVSAHATTDNIRWISHQASALALATVDGVAAYLGASTPPPPPEPDVAAALVQLAEAKNALILAELNMHAARAAVEAAKAALGGLGPPLAGGA